MIELKDVIRMKIPYPSINARLAANSHMYICRKKEGTYYEYVKCQTLKPYMLYNNIIKHYHDEDADITRNPFVHKTRIDCDKVFSTQNILYNDILKTTNRPDICDDAYNKIEIELLADSYDNESINENELKAINTLLV